MFCSKRSWTGLFAAAVGILTALYVSNSQAAPAEFRDLRVDMVGSGRPVLMILGLNSAASTWTETCAALQQYADLKGVKLAMSQHGVHVLMWDDADWRVGEVKAFLAAGR